MIEPSHDGPRPGAGKWTEADDLTLKRMWEDGETSSSIGRAIGKSKNSVISRAHRLLLPARPSPIKAARPLPARPSPIKAARPRPKTVFKRKAAHHSANLAKARTAMPPIRLPPVPHVEMLDGKGVAPADLKSRHCQWPHGDPGDAAFRFCGQPPIGTRPYCEAHCRIAYTNYTPHQAAE
jgi:GcrA cell cycle regulator